MNVCFVADYNCIRVSKEAQALLDRGVKVHLLTAKERGDDIYSSVGVYHSVRQFREMVNLIHSSIDIWHVHNEPNFHTTLLREMLPDAKIVHDLHDSNYWRIPNKHILGGEDLKWISEDMALDCADAAVVTSPACKVELVERFKKPIATIPSAVPWGMFRNREMSFLGGLVSNGAHVKENKILRDGWRDYTLLYEEFQKAGITIYVYMPNMDKSPEFVEYYQKMVSIIKGVPYLTLLDELGMYTWNLVGNKTKEKQAVWDYALPNKFWDGIAAGVPPVVIGNQPTAELVLQYDIGIVINEPMELKERWGENLQKRKNLFMKRRFLCMDNFIGELISMYQDLMPKGIVLMAREELRKQKRIKGGRKEGDSSGGNGKTAEIKAGEGVEPV